MACDVVVRIARARRRPLVFESPVIGSHHKNFDGRLGSKAVIDTFELVVEPPKIDLLHIDSGIVTEVDGVRIGSVTRKRHSPALAMRPGTNHDSFTSARLLRFCALPDFLIVVQRPSQENIEPAVHAEGGNADLFVIVIEADSVPVRVARRVCQPVAIVRRPMVSRFIGRADRKVQEHACPVIAGIVLRRMTVNRDAAPGECEPVMERSIDIEPVRVNIGRRNRGRYGRQILTSANGLGPLGVTNVGAAHRAEFPIEPRLFPDPLVRVEPIADLVLECIEMAVRVPAATYILLQDHIASLCEPARLRYRNRGSSVIRRAHQDRREPAFDVRPINIGRQRHAVPHRHSNVGFGSNSILRLGEL